MFHLEVKQKCRMHSLPHKIFAKLIKISQIVHCLYPSLLAASFFISAFVARSYISLQYCHQLLISNNNVKLVMNHMQAQYKQNRDQFKESLGTSPSIASTFPSLACFPCILVPPIEKTIRRHKETMREEKKSEKCV